MGKQQKYKHSVFHDAPRNHNLFNINLRSPKIVDRKLQKESKKGVACNRVKKLRENKMPLKLKVFVWVAFQSKLQTGEKEEVER